MYALKECQVKRTVDQDSQIDVKEFNKSGNLWKLNCNTNGSWHIGTKTGCKELNLDYDDDKGRP
jgi:hypothetical protein